MHEIFLFFGGDQHTEAHGHGEIQPGMGPDETNLHVSVFIAWVFHYTIHAWAIANICIILLRVFSCVSILTGEPFRLGIGGVLMRWFLLG
jgi:hypothetical protein